MIVLPIDVAPKLTAGAWFTHPKYPSKYYYAANDAADSISLEVYILKPGLCEITYETHIRVLKTSSDFQGIIIIEPPPGAERARSTF